MLPRSKRIPKSLFAEIEKSRQATNAPHFNLRVAKSDETKPRFAVTASKKVAKSAITRNTIRRRVYSVLNPFVSALKPGLYLFIAKKGADKIKGEELSREVALLLKGFERG